MGTVVDGGKPVEADVGAVLDLLLVDSTTNVAVWVGVAVSVGVAVGWGVTVNVGLKVGEAVGDGEDEMAKLSTTPRPSPNCKTMTKSKMGPINQ